MTEPLSLQRDGPVARLRLERAEVHNAFDAGLIVALTAALEQLGAEPGVRAVILEAAGPSFSAGADLGWMRAMAAASIEDNHAGALQLARLMRTLDELPKPTIARVQGAAFGGGVGLVACCDIAIGAASAKFGLTESRLGLLPAVISPYVIAAIGARQARRWFATAETFDATTALRIGLLHEVVADDQLDASVSRQVDLLLRAAPQSTAQAKALIRRVTANPASISMDADNAALIAQLRASEQAREGITAFLEKRKPAWGQ